MLHTSFLTDHLRSEITRSDIADRPVELSKQSFIDGILGRCAHVVQYGFPHQYFAETCIRGKTVYRLDDLPSRVVLRRINRNLRRSTQTKQTDRNTTIRRLSKLLSEGAKHRVYKFDVKSFYETVDIDEIWLSVDENTAIDRKTSVLLRSFIDLCRDNDVTGVPRGLSISATLSELALRGFDQFCRDMEETYFYARYVDDIVLVTNGNEDPEEFKEKIAGQLPTSLRFHGEKSRVFDLQAFKKNDPPDTRAIDFLGYKLLFSQIVAGDGNRLYRDVKIDISDRKANRIKTRLVKSTEEFLHTRDLDDFVDRVKMLTGNYNIHSYRENRRVNVGLYCNYRLVDPTTSSSLLGLDKFFRAWVMGHCGPMSARFSAALSKQERLMLLKYSFQSSFSKRTFHHLSSDRIAVLKSCWSYA